MTTNLHPHIMIIMSILLLLQPTKLNLTVFLNHYLILNMSFKMLINHLHLLIHFHFYQICLHCRIHLSIIIYAIFHLLPFYLIIHFLIHFLVIFILVMQSNIQLTFVLLLSLVLSPEYISILLISPTILRFQPIIHHIFILLFHLFF